MNRKFRQALLLFAVCIIGCGAVNAQGVYKTGASKENTMMLSGTSTLHKWSMKTQTFTGQAKFGFAAGNTQLNSISALTFSLPVLSLKSGEKGLDKNAYKALKTGQFKDILYTLSSAQVMPGTANKYLVKTKGTLTIAGVTQDVAMDVYCIVNNDETITCVGGDKIRMTDYQVKPPSFMAGAMKTGDNISLDFTLVYTK